MQAKFLYEISCVAEDHLAPQKLHGWGNNNAGQLALLTGNLTVKNPTEVALPPFYEREEIARIECGYKCSLLLTTIGRLFISVPLDLKPKLPTLKELKENYEESKGKEKKKDKGAKKDEKGPKKSKSDKKKDKPAPNEKDNEKFKEKPKEYRWDDISFISTNLR